MCSPSVIGFTRATLGADDVRGRQVLEVGSLDVNGSVRPVVESLEPASYLGVDLQAGPGVDAICDAADIVRRFGEEAFDVVISTEMLEHVRDWRLVVSNLKRVLRPGGILVVTTRSAGVDFHRHPFDFWRFDKGDFEFIFSDLIVEDLQRDPDDPGILMKARKPEVFSERDLSGYALYSVLRQARLAEVRPWDLLLFHLRYRLVRLLLDLLPRSARRRIRERLLR